MEKGDCACVSIGAKRKSVSGCAKQHSLKTLQNSLVEEFLSVEQCLQNARVRGNKQALAGACSQKEGVQRAEGEVLARVT